MHTIKIDRNGVTLAQIAIPERGVAGMWGGGDGPQIGTHGLIGTGDGPQTGTGDGPQIGTGDGPQTGTGDGPQIGTGDGPQTGTGYGNDLPIKTGPTPVAPLGPAVIAQSILNFKIQRQQQSEWCWAAVAVSVEKFFDPASKLKQCEVANEVLGQTGCCHNPQPGNQGAELEVPLQKVCKWRSTLDDDDSTGAKGSLTFEQVMREIDRGRPVCAGITWESGGGHFVVLRGYRVLDSGVQQVYVADPLNPSNVVDFDEFTVAYYGEGRWTETDFVANDWS